MASILHGAKSPESFALTIRQGQSGLDLSAVSAVSLQVRRTAGTVTWTTTLSDQSATSLKATHVFAADGSDCPEKDSFEIIALLTLPGPVTRRAGPVMLHVT